MNDADLKPSAGPDSTSLVITDEIHVLHLDPATDRRIKQAAKRGRSNPDRKASP